jgi:hypothetical protein
MGLIASTIEDSVLLGVVDAPVPRLLDESDPFQLENRDGVAGRRISRSDELKNAGIADRILRIRGNIKEAGEVIVSDLYS